MHILMHLKDVFGQILTKLLPCAKQSHGRTLTAPFLHNVTLGCTGFVRSDSSAAGFSVQLCPHLQHGFLYGSAESWGLPIL